MRENASVAAHKQKKKGALVAIDSRSNMFACIGLKAVFVASNTFEDLTIRRYYALIVTRSNMTFCAESNRSSPLLKLFDFATIFAILHIQCISDLCVAIQVTHLGRLVKSASIFQANHWWLQMQLHGSIDGVGGMLVS
jgi:hypothetical protein